jgi:YidC/Oxa1 family membrane protein insertase
MDKTGIVIVSLCIAALIGWVVVQTRTQQQLARQQALFEATNQVAILRQAAQATNANSTLSGVGIQSPATPVALPAAEVGVPAQIIVLTNAHARYTFTSRGGGLQQVDLLDYPETISARWRAWSQSPSNGVATLNTHATEPVLAVLAGTGMGADLNFTLTRTANGVRAEKDFAGGLVLEKDFELSSNYLVHTTVTWRNNSDHSVLLPSQEIVVGTATPMDVDDTGMYLGSTWCDGVTYFDTPITYFNTNTTTLGIIPRKPTPDFHAGNGNVIWAAAHNQFFALLAMTPTNEPAQQVAARPVSLPALANVQGNTSLLYPRGIQTTLVYPAETLTANSSSNLQITLFAGPKEFRTLSLIAEQLNNHADFAMNFGTGYSGFWGVGTFFAKLLLSSMNWLHDVTRMGYGWTIVVITILLRILFWPLTAASMRSAKKMQALAPEVKALKEKYKDDPQKFTQKQMELWKKNKVNPMSGCLPMLVQMPVFFGFLAMIRCAIELRGAHFLWVADLTKPDTVFMIPGLDFPFNLLPLLMVGTMVWQAHLQPPSPGMDESQMKMMRYMPLMFLVFLYNYSSGMALYMTVSTLAGAVQTIMTRVKPVSPVTPALTPATKPKR